MRLKELNCALVLESSKTPEPRGHEVLLEVLACAVCRTDLHLVDGELADLRLSAESGSMENFDNSTNCGAKFKPWKQKLPITPGHEIVGQVTRVGDEVKNLLPGTILGVPWLGSTCRTCSYCLTGKENLCADAKFTGFDLDGGFATHVIADSRYCIELPPDTEPLSVAPLLCAGLIGWRSYKMAGAFGSLGLFGFGAAAHIIAQIAVLENKSVYAFTRPGDWKTCQFASNLGCTWAGGSDELPETMLDAAIIFAPAGELIIQALKAIKPGGTVVCGGIHMSDIPSFPYSLLWGERRLVSVANLTREDASEFFQSSNARHIKTTVNTYRLEQANEALSDLRAGRFDGAAVLDLQC